MSNQELFEIWMNSKEEQTLALSLEGQDDCYECCKSYARAAWQAASSTKSDVERELAAAWPHEIPEDREWANVKAYSEFGNDRFLVDVLTELHIRERQLKAALAANARLRRYGYIK